MKISKTKLFTANDKAHDYKIDCYLMADKTNSAYFLVNDNGVNSTAVFVFSDKPTLKDATTKASSLFPWPWELSFSL